MAELQNKVQWSESRIKMLRECRRKYYLNYYLSWGGWLPTASPECQRAYMLKKMTSLPMWIGSVVHDVIEHVIAYRRASNCKAAMPLEKAESEAVQALREGWLQSTDKLWKKNPGRAVNLFEHYYDVTIPQSKLDEVKQKVLRCLRAFYASPIGKTVNALQPDDFLTLEDFQSVTLNTGELVAVKLDFAFRQGAQAHLVDWKTGKFTGNVIEQLRTYAIYALKQGWVRRVQDVVIKPVFLDTEDPNKCAIELAVDMKLLERQADIIRREWPLLLEADEKQGDIAAFPVTNDRSACKYCPFRDMCPGATAEIPEGVTPF
jgi:hypothetical protein